MAFNPFAAFRKHQKYWMAGAILVCMVTFVLCSGGIRGTGLDDMLFGWFRTRPEYLNIHGRSYTQEEIGELKKQRDIANDFMRELANLAVKRLTDQINSAPTSDKQDKDFAFLLHLRKTCVTDLFAKLQREPRYFRGGVKLDDLVEFILWRKLADDYGVTITDDLLNVLVVNSCNGALWGFDPDVSSELESKVGYIHHAGKGAIFQALKQEFRVQIAQLTLATRWSRGPQDPSGYYERDLLAAMPASRGFPHIFLNTPMQARITPTPEQINASFRKNRTEMTIELLPVSLEMLAKKVEVPTDPAKRLQVLKEFYDKHAKNKYDPSLETPGFLFPERAKFQFLAADAGMEYYQQPAKAVSLLQKSPPVAFNPLSPLEGSLGWLADRPAWDAALAQNLQAERDAEERKWDTHYRVLTIFHNNYLNETDDKKKADAKTFYESRVNEPPPTYKNSASPWTTSLYYSPGQFNLALEKPNAQAAASIVSGINAGPFAGLAAFQGFAYEAQAQKIAPMVPLDRTKRVEVGTELLLARSLEISGGGPFTAAALTFYAGTKQQFLPVAGYIENELRTKIEDRLAQRWVNGSDDKDKGYGMLFVKKQLESRKGNQQAFPAQLQKLMDKFQRTVVDKDGKTRTIPGFIFGESQERNEFDIEFDETLKPLRDSFDKYRLTVNLAEGRAGKPDLLREGDFSKLFFGSEPLGAGSSAELYVLRAWPPNTVNKARVNPLAPEQKQLLFDKAEKPVIFWKSAKKGAEPMPWQPEIPTMLDFVEMQYRLSAARATLLAEAKKIAEDVKKAQRTDGVDLVTAMRELAKQFGTDLVTLPKVAVLIENTTRRGDEPAYLEYELPRFKVPFPRPDMVKQLLALRTLTGPLKVEAEDFKDLNELNNSMFSAELAKNPKAKVGQVQVLTNKPRSVYYIATVASANDPGNFTFQDSMPMALSRDGTQGLFITQVQEELGRDLMRELAQFLRTRGNVQLSEDAQKHKAEEPPGQ